MKKNFGLIGVLLFAFSLAQSGTARADSGSATFSYLVGVEPLCAIGASLGIPAPCPDVARADNGDTVQVTGSGTVGIHAKSVSGGGTFKHKNAAGTTLASGTWSATRLVSFNDYGAGADGFSAFHGGRALMNVTLFVGGTAVHTAILEVTCRLPGDNGPSEMGSEEGIRLAVQDALNFNKKVSGITVYIPAP